MSAKQKLQESKFFLEKLRGSLQLLPQDLTTRRESNYYLSAFLAAAVSVFDHLLEDYNVKFSLGILLTDKLHPDAFRKEATRTSNHAALRFLEWWAKEKKALEQNDPIGKLLNKRHLNIHRKQTRPDLAKIKTGDGNLPTSGSLGIKVFREGKLAETRNAQEQPGPKPKIKETTFDWFFSDYPDEPVINACEKLLASLESFVSEAEKTFP